MSARKDWESIVAGGRDVRFRDFIRVVEAFGFRHKRTKGSHRIYVHPKVSRPLNLQPRGGRAKPYQIAQLLEIIEAFGLRMDE